MKTFLTTDTHFNHKKLIEYGRPENFEELIWEGLKKIPAGSTLIHLGDICIGNDAWVHSELALLPIKRILVKGNHDGHSNSWYLEHGWDFVCEKFSDNYFGTYITFSHIPVKRVKNLNIHGHFHDSNHRRHEPEIVKYYKPTLHKLLAIELTDYQPVDLEEFLIKIKNEK